jgi:hypothetical protein
MPARLRAFADVNPISHLVTAARALMDRTAAAGLRSSCAATIPVRGA